MNTTMNYRELTKAQTTNLQRLIKFAKDRDVKLPLFLNEDIKNLLLLEAIVESTLARMGNIVRFLDELDTEDNFFIGSTEYSRILTVSKVRNRTTITILFNTSKLKDDFLWMIPLSRIVGKQEKYEYLFNEIFHQLYLKTNRGELTFTI